VFVNNFEISIGCFGISTTTVMTLSSFRAMPCQGHMDCVKGRYGYLTKMNDAVIGIQVEEPDLSGLPEKQFDWSNTMYSDVKEINGKDNPEPLGNYSTMMHYFDTNLYHDLISIILHLFNKNLI
jgi:hypothetical protein